MNKNFELKKLRKKNRHVENTKMQRADSNRQPEGYEPYELPLVLRCITMILF